MVRGNVILARRTLFNCGDIVKQKNVQRIAALCALVLLIAALCLLLPYWARPLLELAAQPEAFRLWLGQFGPLAYLIVLLLVALKVVLPMLPGKIFEIAAGYCFGFVPGVLLVLGGTALGTAVVLLLVKCFGVKLARRFVTDAQMKNFALWKNQSRFSWLCFLIYVIPGTPKDALTYLIALSPIKPARLLLITTFARIPTVTAGVLGGDALGSRNYWLAALALGGTLLLSGLGILWYRKRLK